MAFKVMFVDDEPAVLGLFRDLAQPLGCEVLALANSREALDRVTSEKFDGAFVDAGMPNPDGFEFTKSLRASSFNSFIPVAMLSGHDDAETMRKGFSAGITFFLGKPINQARLTLAVRTMRGPMLREKQRYTRLAFKTPVTCFLGKRAIASESVNLSEGGLLLSKPIGRLGDEAALEFALPTASEALKPRAKIVRLESSGRTAFQFLAIAPAELDRLRRYITERIRE